jgi:hypothetical protein
MNNALSLDLAPLQSFATPKLGAVASPGRRCTAAALAG